MSDGSLRASDDDRDRAIAALREHLLAGRLSLDEFGERVQQVLTARVMGDLARAQDDLPAVVSPGSAPPHRTSRFAAAVFGRVVRRGRLRLPRRSVASAVLGDLDLDLREVTVDHQRTVVNLLPLLGNVDVYVPEGVNVEVTGLTVFGHVRDWGRDLGSPDAPAIHLRAFGFAGTIDVWRVPHDMHGDYGELFRQLQAQQGELPG